MVPRSSYMALMACRLRGLARSRRRRLFVLELSSRHRWYVGPLRRGLTGFCLLLTAAIIWSGLEMAELSRERTDRQVRSEQVREQDRRLIAQAREEGVDLSPGSLQHLPAEVALANQLLVKRHFSWTQFLAGLETVIPPGVAIKSIRLDPVSATIYLTGAAVTVEAVTSLALTLQNHPIFRDPVLGKHHAGADGLVEFDISLKYSPQGA